MQPPALVLLAVIGVAAGCAGPAAPPEPAPPPQATAPAPPPCQRIARIVVHKSDRLLTAYCERGAVISLPIAVGRGSRGPKRMMGDLRTPEGEYHIAGPARPSQFHLFLPIDYPSLADADAALFEGAITEGEHRRIAEAHRQGDPPPGDTALGGTIGFHGEGRRWQGESRFLDWTLGCVALSDPDIDFLAERVEVGTPVSIIGVPDGP